MEIPFVKPVRRFIRYGMTGRAEIKRLRAKIDELQARNGDLTDLIIKGGGGANIETMNVTNISQFPPDRVTAYDQKTGIMFFGTRHGDLAVRFDNAETVIEDIKAWLFEKELNASPSPNALRAILDLD